MCAGLLGGSLFVDILSGLVLLEAHQISQVLSSDSGIPEFGVYSGIKFFIADGLGPVYSEDVSKLSVLEGVDGVFQVFCQCPYFTVVEEDTGNVGIEGSHFNLDDVVLVVEDVLQCVVGCYG